MTKQIHSLQNVGIDEGVLFSSYNDFKRRVVRFSFANLLADASQFGAKGKTLALKDYHKLFDRLKDLSCKRYFELEEEREFYHFHPVNLDDTKISVASFISMANLKMSPDEFASQVTVYQFEVFKEFRIFGFVSDYTFHIVLFDRNHNVYKRK